MQAAKNARDQLQLEVNAAKEREAEAQSKYMQAEAREMEVKLSLETAQALQQGAERQRDEIQSQFSALKTEKESLATQVDRRRAATMIVIIDPIDSYNQSRVSFDTTRITG